MAAVTRRATTPPGRAGNDGELLEYAARVVRSASLRPRVAAAAFMAPVLERLAARQDGEDAVRAVGSERVLRVALRLEGYDPVASEVPQGLEELSWEGHGAVSAAVLYHRGTPAQLVEEAVTWAELVAVLMPGVTVAGVHDELVAAEDVAARCGVAPAAVRYWQGLEDGTAWTPRAEPLAVPAFPSPVQCVRGEPLWRWREVAAWARDVIGTDPDEGTDYLGTLELAYLDYRLATLGRLAGALLPAPRPEPPPRNGTLERQLSGLGWTPAGDTRLGVIWEAPSWEGDDHA